MPCVMHEMNINTWAAKVFKKCLQFYIYISQMNISIHYKIK